MTTPQRARRAVSEKVRAVPNTNLIERRMSRFLRSPPSIRLAASVIVTATAIVVVGGGVLMRLFDHREYRTIWVGMWWALQTVTTVGYGDVTPRRTIGRLIGAFVMLEGIAFLSIVTAAITSTFVARAAQERASRDAAAAETQEQHFDARFDKVDERLDRLESLLRANNPQS
jgi:voltage-gated potassium channel Kch